MILVIDNYDSFTWNLVHCIGMIDAAIGVEVLRNDELTVDDVASMAPSHIVLSPGPCTPAEAGVCGEVVRSASGDIPILGVCLGHQVIAAAHGMRVVRHDEPIHGKTSRIHHDGRGVFEGVPDPFEATRYHSLVVDPDSVSDDFEVSARTEDGVIMALRWRQGWPDGPDASITGVQFHPESFMSVRGPDLVRAFLHQPRSTSRAR